MTKTARRGRPRKRRSVSVKPLPLGGDHGTGMQAAVAGTVVEPLEGKNPNNLGRRVRTNVITTMVKRETLTMRQAQAAQAIQEAHCRVEMLSSGSELKEQVQSTPKPDATVAVQVEAMSNLARVTKKVLRSERDLVEWVCVHNIPLDKFARATGGVRPLDRFRVSMDRVADHLGY